MKKNPSFLLAITFICIQIISACGSATQYTPTTVATSLPTNTMEAATAKPTNTPIDTESPTPLPTDTPTSIPTATATPIPQPDDYLPNTLIPEGMYYPGASNRFFDVDHGKTLAVGNHWVVYSPDLGSMFPIPEGWNTQETEAGITFITFVSPLETDVIEPTIVIRLDIVKKDEQNIQEVMLMVADSQKDKLNTHMLNETLIDENSGYFLFISGSEGKEHLTIYYLAAVSNSPGSYYRWIAQVKKTNWELCYPILRAMIANWAETDYQPLGIILPEDLGR